MARPESFKDLSNSDRFVRIALFEIDKIMTSAVLLKHYSALLEAVQKHGGKAEKSYSTIEVMLPKDQQELQQQLEYDQRTWDNRKKEYNLAVNRGPSDADFPEWKVSNLKLWAKENDLPDPFDVFAANDPELAAIRNDLEMDE